MKFNNILVVSPHTDDGELGAGGFIASQIKKGAKVTFLTLCIAEDSVPTGLDREILGQEALESAKSFGLSCEDLIIHRFPVRRLSEHRQEILEILVALKKNNYDLILCPSSQDVHQDHSVVYNEVVRAFKGTSILGFDLPWNNLLEQQIFFYEISYEDLDKKVNSLRCYRSQKFRKYTSQEFLQSLAIIRGAIVGVDLAEKFEVIRMVVK